MLAIIRALEEWRHFLEGARHNFEIWSDHKNLEYFMTAKNLNRRQARWSLTLARYDFTMIHKPGTTMGKADALSRCSDHGDRTFNNQNIVSHTPTILFLLQEMLTLLKILPTELPRGSEDIYQLDTGLIWQSSNIDWCNMKLLTVPKGSSSTECFGFDELAMAFKVRFHRYICYFLRDFY